MTLLAVKSIECRYRDVVAISEVSFHVKRGEIVSLLGPSGCGKTTVLRAIAGFEPLLTGRIVLNDEEVSRPGYTLPTEKRRIGMVFQDYALFPHLSVQDNICFGLKGKPGNERRDIARRMLKTVGLEGYAKRYPHELSGGQQQRVALARALAPHPDLLLMDEPFSSLDVDLRERLSQEVRDILRDEGITGILVTHDQHEAFAMCERIGVMSQGRLMQWDTPFNLYHEPAERFVADFIGQGRFLRGTLLAPDTLETEAGVIQGNRAFAWPTGSDVDVLLRPDDITPDPDSALTATVVDKAFKGAETMYTLRLETGSTVLSLLPSHSDYQLDDRIGVRIAADHLVCFPRTRI